MNKPALLNAIAEQIGHGRNHPRGILGVMEDEEANAGYTIVPIGSKSPFLVSQDDWETALISLDGKDVRIVLVVAKQKGRGAFGRLVKAIQDAGYRPIVIEPVAFDMPAIMKKWHWKKKRRNGTGWESWEEWRPRA